MQVDTDLYSFMLCVNTCAEQLAILQPDQWVTIRNAHIDMFKAHMRLSVDRWALIEAAQPQKENVKTDNNMSETEYELVNVPA